MNAVFKSVKQTWFFTIILVFFALGLLLYSFTQADLNLPISAMPLVGMAENLISTTGIFGSDFTFQNIGYFERPLSTNLYVSILVGLFLLYGLFLYLVKNNKVPLGAIVVNISLLTVILFWSYPAFSYDLYNYMFDARIFTKYNENPYLHKALDYPQDPWINVMRWTHRTYPYGPTWLLVTIPLSYIGFQDFGVTLLLFKLIMAGSYIGSCYFIYKILKFVKPKLALFGTAFFAFNPLIIIESLVSAHNDIVMMFLAVWAYYLLLQKRRVLSVIMLLVSIGIKFATVFLIPLFVLELFPKQFKNISFENKIMIGIGGMAVAIIAASIRTQFQPWYLLYIFPLTSFVSNEKWIQVVVWVFTIAALSMYIPYLYTGSWNPPIPTLLNQILASACIVSAIFCAYSWTRK